jgi:hypothetical protein
MNKEQRTDQRVALNIPVRWDGLAGEFEARIKDLSLGGCFVKTRGMVNPGELIILEIKLPSGEWLPLRGEVTSYQPTIGFGLVFPFLTGEEEQELRVLLAGWAG